jgi:hypothetical protein
MCRSASPVRVALHYKVHRPVPEVMFGLAILRGDRLWSYGTNTAIDGILLPPLGDEGRVEVLTGAHRSPGGHVLSRRGGACVGWLPI